MILKSLEHFDVEAARGVARDALAAIVELRKDTPFGPVTANVEAVLHDLAKQSKVDLTRAISARDRLKLLSLATDALTTIAIGNLHPRVEDDISGKLGILKLDEYEITGLDRDDWIVGGVDRATTTTTVTKPDAYQHIQAKPIEGVGEGSSLSVFVRRLNAAQSGPAQWCLVVAGRMGRKLNLGGAFRVFQDDYSLDVSTARPLDLLSAFADKYGSQMSYQGQALGSVIVDRQFPGSELEIQLEGGMSFRILSDGRLSLTTPEKLEPVHGFSVHGLFTRLADPPMTIVTFAFSLSQMRYEVSLEKRGVAHAPRRKAPPR